MRITGTGLLLCALALSVAAGEILAAGGKEKIPAGAFYARRIEKAPTIDGKIEPGEWDGALVATGMITIFENKPFQAETTWGFAFDSERFYFLANCARGPKEWKLWKTARQNDDYSFGDPSIEIWVAPPKAVPETYQNIINTYPAVMDVHNIPSRGYSAMGWTGNWTLGVQELDDRYIIEASIPIKAFGIEQIKDGDVWKFLLARTSPGTESRPQASWGVTGGFAEIPGYPDMHLMDDTAMLQVYGTASLFTGAIDFPMAVVAPRTKAEEVTVDVRVQKEIAPHDGDQVISKTVKLAPGKREEFRVTGDTGDLDIGFVSVTARAKDGTEIYRHMVPFAVNGYVASKPQRPEKDREIVPLAVMPMYGPENNVVLVKADIIDHEKRSQVASARVKVVDPATEAVLQEQEMPPFVEWYSNGVMFLDAKKVQVPVYDPAGAATLRSRRAGMESENKKRVARGQEPMPLPEIPEGKPEPRKVLVEVAILDGEGNVLDTNSSEISLLGYRFEWQNNTVGVTDEVIPPWTPVAVRGGQVGVWNRQMQMNGLGLLEKVDNGGVSQIESMRLVAEVGGKRIDITPGQPELLKQVDAYAILRGTGEGAGLKCSATTQVEFDGFVLSDLTIAPADAKAPATVDKVYLEIVLPESEATHYCTTAGGWAAVHDVTPAYWSSIQTASGMLIGDFVPYIWLTNSDRAFCWFADNDKGWITDDDKSLPTQEIIRKDGKVTLRVHFIELPTTLTEATTVQYGYQTYPSRPLPDGWRAIVCANNTSSLPSAVNTYFWTDADWAVLWPYYCSPFPWNMEKSKGMLENTPRHSKHRPMVGSIAHSIGRYQEYSEPSKGKEGRQLAEFPEFVVDWGATPGDRSNANTTQGRGPVDFRLWFYQRWVREAGFRGLYVDENYLALEDNFLTGGAYIRADKKLQRGYSYLGLREYFKRMKIMFHQNHVPTPNLWQHISSGAAYYAWFGDIFFEGENVEPSDLQYDYMEVLPAGRLRAIGSATCAGGAMTMMCQSQRHSTIYEPKHTHQFVGWVMSHDVLPEQVQFYNVIAQEARFYEPGIEFLGYWKADNPVRTSTPECLVSAHKGAKRTMLWVVNTSRQDKAVDVQIDFAKLGLDKAKTLAVDCETGAIYPFAGGGLQLDVLQRDFVGVHLIERTAMQGSQSFLATFDTVDAPIADEALGSCVFVGGPKTGQITLVQGAQGKGIQGGVAFWPHLNLTADQGRLAFQALITGPARGVFSAGLLDISVQQGKDGKAVVLTSDLNPMVQDAKSGRWSRSKDKDKIRTVSTPVAADGWTEFDLSWKGNIAVLKVNGQPAGEIQIQDGALGIPAKAQGGKLDPGSFTFGGAAAYDNIRGYRTAE